MKKFAALLLLCIFFMGCNSLSVNLKGNQVRKYTFDQFSKIQMGMSLDQVKNILGEGKQQTSMNAGGNKTEVYTWQNSDATNISIMFQNDKVVRKGQSMLIDMDAKVSLEKYNKVNIGMTYDQVKAVLGEGEIISQALDGNTKTETYEWMNSNGSNINITFQDGKSVVKDQNKLK